MVLLLVQLMFCIKNGWSCVFFSIVLFFVVSEGCCLNSPNSFALLMSIMKHGVLVQHVAVEYPNENLAERFFSLVLGLPKVKSSLLSKELSEKIFKIQREVRFDFYDNGATRFEVFITDEPRQLGFAHICITVDDKKDFISRCKEQGLTPFLVQKGDKELLFVRDFSDNLFEVLEN